ncbi:MAG TPA: hypothetical protein VF187_00350 [Gemmatimonadales bacterium]
MKAPRPSRRGWLRALLGALLLAGAVTLIPVNRPMEITGFPVPAGADSVIIAVGERYRANGIQRFLQGEHYRELWTLPIPVEVLDLATFDGGLRPTDEGGGMQTRTLHFVSGTGRQWGFRSIDKEPTRAIHPLFRRGIIAWMLQDQTSSSHPAGALVVAPLEAALGLPPDHPRMVVLPHDSTLGAYRAGFGGVVGMLRERPGEDRRERSGPGDPPPTRNTEELEALLDSVSTERVDASGLLTARLLDFFLNDWDRHPGQWRWGGRPGPLGRLWFPIPVDRDQAFSWYDGFVMGLARIRTPKLAGFGPRLPPLRGLVKNSEKMDRRLLGSLTRAEWDSVAAFVRGRLTDSVIEDAVNRMPSGYRRVSGAFLASALKQRREQIPGIAREFYLRSALDAEVHAAGDGALTQLFHQPDGGLEVLISIDPGKAPVFHRLFRRGETRRVTLFLHGPGNRIAVSGIARRGIEVRIIDDQGRRVAPASRR